LEKVAEKDCGGGSKHESAHGKKRGARGVGHQRAAKKNEEERGKDRGMSEFRGDVHAKEKRSRRREVSQYVGKLKAVCGVKMVTKKKSPRNFVEDSVWEGRKDE